MTYQWLVTGAALATAAVALARARSLAKRLDRITEAYWELRYEQGQLKARLARLDPSADPGAAEPNAPRPPGTAAFIPLSSLKR